MKLREFLAQIDSGTTYHFIDTETTGSRSAGARVIEVGVASWRQGAIVGRFETLVDAGVPVPAFITRLTGISAKMLVGQPAPLDAYAAFDAYLDAVGHGAFVAHNASFDWGFLTMEYQRLDRPWPFTRKHCTVKLARHCLPQLRSRSLETLIQHFAIPVPARHRALADAEATCEIFARLVEQLRAGARDPARV